MGVVQKIQLPLLPPIDSPWNLVVSLLTSPRIWLNSDNIRADEKPRLVHRAYALAEMIRLKWKPRNFKEFKTNAQVIKLEGILWWRTLELIEAVFMLDPLGYEHPSLCFIEVVMEERLCGLFRIDEGGARQK